MLERISPLRFRHTELASRLFEKSEIGDLRNTERLRDFGVLAYQVDHQLNPFGSDRHVAHDTAPELLEHFSSEAPIGEPPLIQNDIDHLVSVARLEAKEEAAQ